MADATLLLPGSRGHWKLQEYHLGSTPSEVLEVAVSEWPSIYLVSDAWALTGQKHNIDQITSGV